MAFIPRHSFPSLHGRVSTSAASFIGLLVVIVAIVVMGPSAAADKNLRDHRDHRMGVFVSILPQQYFLRHIGGELIDIHVMVPPGASPHTYEPKPRQMRDIAGAQIYFAIGVPFEKVWLPKISTTNPEMQIIQTDHGITKIHMDADHEHHNASSAHEPESGHDPHIWLSPVLVRGMAGHILNALVMADPEHQEDYQRNYQQFCNDIKALDAELHGMLDPLTGGRFMVFHPSWGYFARDYGLVQIPMEVQGKAPKPAQLQHLVQSAKALGIKAVIVQPQFSSKSAGVIADAIDGRVVTADPMAQTWAENLQQLARQLQTIVK